MLLSVSRSLLARQSLSPLAIPDFRRMLLGNVFWWQSFYMEQVVMGWLVLELTNSPWLVSVVSFCRSLPLLLVGTFGGLIIDRFGRRSVIVAAQTANLCAYLCMALLLWSGRIQLWHMMLLAFCLGTAWAMDWPARRALLPDLVGKARTVDSMLIDSFLTGIARIIGPSIAGAVIASWGAAGCYSVMAMLSLSALMVLQTLQKQPIPRDTMRPTAPPWTLIGHGLRYVRQNQTLLAVILITLVMNLWIFPYMTLLSVFARDVLQQGPLGLGLMSTASGIGAFLGLMLINVVRRRVGNGWIYGLGSLWMCVMLFGFALSKVYGVSLVLLFCAGMGISCFGTMQSAIILITASDEMRSRVMGLLVLAIGADPLGQLQIGFWAERLGAPFALTLQTSLAALAIGLIIILMPGLRTPVTSEAVGIGD
ncbi:MAG: MFS transporter [Caldilineaceae bacterium]|nr:MFS transporter [Caldilineaceae bacterium]MCB0095536.1 MFS transporter [Caldilineaceae bacterium]MCB0144981.1 MFS transporter [Caldilineaceae bacterium]